MKSYVESGFLVGLQERYEGVYRYQVPSYQEFKLHFQYGGLGGREYSFFEDVLKRKGSDKQDISPCLKVVHPKVQDVYAIECKLYSFLFACLNAGEEKSVVERQKKEKLVELQELIEGAERIEISSDEMLKSCREGVLKRLKEEVSAFSQPGCNLNSYKGYILERYFGSKRLQGCAKGTVFLPNFEESCSQSLARLCADISRRFPREDIGSLGYGLGFIPYCPGVFIRKAFKQVKPGKYQYVSGYEVEKILSSGRASDWSSHKLEEACMLRNELRASKMYKAMTDQIHEFVLADLHKAVVAMKEEKKDAAVELWVRIRSYKTHGYRGAALLLAALQKAVEKHPLIKQAELAPHYNRYKAELGRAEEFFTMRCEKNALLVSCQEKMRKVAEAAQAACAVSAAAEPPLSSAHP